jgi:hypothetical protein
LRETVAELGDTSIDTHLKLQLDGRNPDDGMTDVAYEKGNNLLMLIEKTVGREKLDAFLKSYFQRHRFQSITTEQFLSEYKSELIKDDSAEAKAIDIEKWIYSPGIPSNMVKIESSKFNHVDKEVTAFKNGTSPAKLDTKNFTAFEWIRFLRSLPDTLSLKQMKELDDAFHFTKSGNSEILFVWLQHVIASKYEHAYPALDNFLITVGRRKFVKPLYQQLAKTTEGKEMAKKIYAQARPNYHPITQGSIDELLK